MVLKHYWFRTSQGLGYGVTASSKSESVTLLNELGYPRTNERILEVVEGIRFSELDANHVVPNMGPMQFQGVWFPNHTC